VARAYADWLDVLIFDEQDRALGPDVARAGVRPIAAPTIMSSRETEVELARRILDALRPA
jgi:hypothetical protein